VNEPKLVLISLLIKLGVAAAVSAFRDGWIVIGAVSAASAIVGLLVLPVRIRAAVPIAAGSTAQLETE